MADSGAPLIAGVELGGTKCIATIARGTDVLAQARFPTTDPDTTLAIVGHQLQVWAVSIGAPRAIGIGSFGPLGLDSARGDYGRITATPKAGWAGTDLIGCFARLFDVPIGFDTDVAGAALAEYRWGAAKEAGVAVYLTVGTGIGGGVLVDGRPVHGLIHPEIGHIRLRRVAGDRFAGVCPFHGDCIEGLASGPAIAARAGRAGESVGADDPVWDHVAADMAELCAALLMALSPQKLLIGGGVFGARAGLLERVRAATLPLLGGYLHDVDAGALARIILPPALGDGAGPLGAIALGRAALGLD